MGHSGPETESRRRPHIRQAHEAFRRVVVESDEVGCLVHDILELWDVVQAVFHHQIQALRSAVHAVARGSTALMHACTRVKWNASFVIASLVRRQY